MRHCDPETLSLAALGCEPLTSDDEEHLSGCSDCRHDLQSLRRVVLLGRSAPAERLVAPPDGTWQRIAQQIAEPQRGLRSVPPPPAGGAARSTPSAARPAKRTRTWLPMAAAAMFGVVIGGAGMLAVVVDQQSSPAPIAESQAPEVLYSAALSPLPDSGGDTGGTGSADVESIGSGRVLAVATEGLAPTTGYYEVWLIDPDTMEMISVGSVGTGEDVALLPIPDKVDLAKYSVVDISDEPVDGDPTHSNVSVLRGQLPA